MLLHLKRIGASASILARALVAREHEDIPDFHCANHHARISLNLVGATRFEPATSSTPWKRATKLRHAPTEGEEYHFKHPRYGAVIIGLRP